MINKVLAADAVTCTLMGVLLTCLAPGLAELLLLPESLLFYAGVALLPIALFMAVLSMQAVPSLAGVWLVIIGNAAWVAASVAVLALTAPNALGVAFVVLQAAVVAAMAAAEWATRPRRVAGFA